jgi:hypothetical protein
VEFAYYLHYCKNLKFEDRPDYSTLKSLFVDLLISRHNLQTELTFDWFDEKVEEKKKEEEVTKSNLLSLSNYKEENINNQAAVKI